LRVRVPLPALLKTTAPKPDRMGPKFDPRVERRIPEGLLTLSAATTGDGSALARELFFGLLKTVRNIDDIERGNVRVVIECLVQGDWMAWMAIAGLCGPTGNYPCDAVVRFDATGETPTVEWAKKDEHSKFFCEFIDQPALAHHQVAVDGYKGTTLLVVSGPFPLCCLVD